MTRQRIAGALSAATVLVGLGLLSLAACNGRPGVNSDEQLRQQTAQATERAKEQSRQVLADARVAAVDAEHKVNAISAGVQQGLRSPTSAAAPATASSPTDLNRATQGELAELPGISQAKAREIIRHRPYRSAHQLVDRGVLTEGQFSAIAPDVAAE